MIALWTACAEPAAAAVDMALALPDSDGKTDRR
jgi:hypothetical protein